MLRIFRIVIMLRIFRALHFSTTLALFSAAALTLPASGFAAAPETPAATAESKAKGKELFARVVDAMGGIEALERVTSLQSVFTSTRKMSTGDVDMKVVSTQSLPDKVHQELETLRGSITIVLNSTEAFVNTSLGVRTLPHSRRAEMLKSVWRQPINLVRRIDDPEVVFQSPGQESIDGARLEMLLVTVDGHTTRFFVDPDTFIELTDELVVADDQLADWKSDRQGVLVDHRLATRFGWELGDQIRIVGDIYPVTVDLNVRAVYSGAEEAVYFHRDYVEEALGRPGAVRPVAFGGA